MPKCPHCGREITSLSLEVAEVVRYDEIYLDDKTPNSFSQRTRRGQFMTENNIAISARTALN